MNGRAWDNYDNWRLSSPYDDDRNIEVFETEKYGYFSTDENAVNDFDRGIQLYAYHVLQECYDDREEYMEESAGNLAHELDLYESEDDAIESYLENERSEKEYYMEQKAEYKREMKRLKGWL
jgi:hypothetical protein